MKEALLRMGYRLMSPELKIWGKPLGFCLLCYKEKQDEIFVYFKSAKGEVRVWSSKNLLFEDTNSLEEALSVIRMFEVDAVKAFSLRLQSDFQFLTNEQVGELYDL